MVDCAPGRRGGHDATSPPQDQESQAITACLSPSTAEGLPLLQALGGDAHGDEVTIRIDGRLLRVIFEPDRLEHAARTDRGVGAVTSTGLLHALWLLPAQVPVAPSAVPDVKLDRLRAAPQLVREDQDGLHRLYSPAGRVTAIGVMGCRPWQVIEATALQSPAFRRMALVERTRSRISPALARNAIAAGIGLALVDSVSTETLVPSPRALLGVPGVFRWWIAELAYRAWSQDRSQLVS